MHHSCVVTETAIDTMHGNNTDKKVGMVDGEVTNDMFYNDSISTGLDFNELQGTVDDFDTQQSGEDVVSHNNLPEYAKFFVFIMHRNTPD